MRLFISVLATTAMFLAASAASAFTFSVIGTSTSSGNALNVLEVGDQVTIDIRVSADADIINGVGASAFGYDESIVDFASGEAVDQLFYEDLIPIGGGNFFAANGFDNLVGGVPLAESSIGANGNRVTILSIVSSSSFAGQPQDPGLDGVVGGGDAMFRLVFTATGTGSTSILIGTGYEGDAVVLPNGDVFQANGATVNLTVIPEPGTALLMGLGLAGLAAVGRR